MPTAFIMEFPGGTAAEYDAVVDEMQLGGKMAPGGQFHAAGPSESGWRVADVWDSPDKFHEFAETKIGPITAKHGLGAPQVQELPVETVRIGQPGDIAFMQFLVLAGVDGAQFAELDDQVLPDGGAPDGCAFHVNGPHPDGWYVLDYWTDKGKRDAFMQENVGPVMATAGLAGPPDIAETDVHNALTEQS
jgi:hypothetical protein